MAITITELINKLSTTPHPGNRHNLPVHLTLWEIMLNQNGAEAYGANEMDFLLWPDREDFIKDLIQTLIDRNHIIISSPETGEIIFQMDPETGFATINEI